MQQSMTGYGRDEQTVQNFLIKTEIKSLNSKFFDLTARYSKEFSAKEIEIRNLVSDKLKRGKVTLSVDLSLSDNGVPSVQVDSKLFKIYFDNFQALATDVGKEGNGIFELALQAPGIIKQQELDADQIPWAEVFESVRIATDHCIQYRNDEGVALEEKLNEYTLSISTGLISIEAMDKNREQHIRSRLQKNLEEIKEKVQIDENRFEQELTYYLERLDITEEKVRLKQHLDYFTETLQKEGQAGKKLGFISQEMGREINTIGSKANDAEIQRTVVTMKDELLKIKEQGLNIL